MKPQDVIDAAARRAPPPIPYGVLFGLQPPAAKPANAKRRAWDDTTTAAKPPRPRGGAHCTAENKNAAKARRDGLLAYLAERGKSTTQRIARDLTASLDTTLKDLRVLERDGKVISAREPLGNRTALAWRLKP